MILTDNALVMPEKVSELLESHFGESLNWQPMHTAGTRHNLFIANHADACWVARVAPALTPPPGVDSLREAKVLARVRNLEQVVRPRIVDTDSGLLLMPFQGKAFEAEALDECRLRVVVNLINRLHAITDVPSIDYPRLFEQYRQHFTEAHYGLVQLVDETEQSLNELPDIGECLVHHDLHAGNLLWNPELHLIDWEYAGLGNPWLDYATLTRDLGLKLHHLREFDRLADLSDEELEHGVALAIEVVDRIEMIWQHFVALEQPEQLTTTLTTGETEMSTTKALLQQLDSAPNSVEFDQVMAVIAAEYQHTPSAFKNGDQVNSADQNQGSCKILGFARLNGLTEQATLNCFGKYYREDVLQNPEGTDHGNIRAFMRSGWAGVELPESAVIPNP